MKIEKHHLLYHRVQHDATPETKWLRNQANLIIPMKSTEHARLHRDNPVVPVLDIYTARYVRKAYYSHRSPIESTLNYIEAIERVIDLEPLHDTQKRLGELVIASVKSQIKYLEVGYVEPQI